MARHKHKKPRVKVYFRYNENCYKLLEAINFGTRTSPELKINGLTETYLQIKDNLHRFDGNFHVGQFIRFVEGNHVEFTYHKDGLILTEVIHPSGEKEYTNPYGNGEKWTPLPNITTYQPVMVIQLLTLSGYRKAFIEEKFGLKNYIVKNNRIFDLQKGEGIMVLVYLKHKDYPLAKYCFDDTIYSDVIMNFGENLELCILIQKQMHQGNTGGMIKNHFLFVDKLDGFEYLSEVLRNHIFDKTFAEFMNVVQEGNRYFNISETMMQIIESVDPLYDSLIAEKIPIQVHKPTLVKLLLDRLDGKYNGYLKLSEEEQMKSALALYLNAAIKR